MDHSHIDYLKKLILQADEVLATHRPNSPGVIGFPTLDSGAFNGWRAKSISFLTQHMGYAPTYAQEFDKEVAEGYIGSAKSGKSILEGALSEIIEGGAIAQDLVLPATPMQNLETIFVGFHRVARQLRQRRENRSTLDISDEYDVQDLLYALLRMFFTDIRAEEYTPSYGSGSSRQDFLLKKERVVVETKMTRDGLRDKQLVDELIIDKERYAAHPDCSALVCFVYDPRGLITNPSGIINDLEQDEPYPVRVIIEPQI